MKRHRVGVGVAMVLACGAVLLAQDRYVSSDGASIRYVVQGRGESVVLIHGYTGSVEDHWVTPGVMSRFAQDYQVVALDLRGHGKSAKPYEASAHARMEQDVVRVLDDLKIARAHIVGYSLGGVFVNKLLVTNPDRVHTAVLVASPGRRSWSAKDDEAAQDAARELMSDVPYRSLVLRLAPTDRPRPSEEAVRSTSARLAAGNDPKAHAALALARKYQVVTVEELARTKTPSLAVVGTADPVVNSVRAMKKGWPGLIVEEIEGATHAGERSILTQPSTWNRVAAFFREHPTF